jgi:hypothetical protein
VKLDPDSCSAYSPYGHTCEVGAEGLEMHVGLRPPCFKTQGTGCVENVLMPHCQTHRHWWFWYMFRFAVLLCPTLPYPWVVLPLWQGSWQCLTLKLIAKPAVYIAASRRVCCWHTKVKQQACQQGSLTALLHT